MELRERYGMMIVSAYISVVAKVPKVSLPRQSR